MDQYPRKAGTCFENNTPRDPLVHDLFEEQVHRAPQALAVIHGRRRLTYAELNRHANQLARYLVSPGVGPDQPVGILIERSIEMVIGLLGILKAGAAYLPLDPNYPADRLRYMLGDAVPRVLLTQTELMSLLPATKSTLVDLSRKLADIEDNCGDNLEARELGVSCANLVYLIYTSGSTGAPKGTQMEHHSMVNLIEWHRQSLGSSEERRVLQFAALSFDVAFQEIFTTLCTGGTLILLDEWVRRDVRALVDAMNAQHVDRVFLPPLMLQTLAEFSQRSGTKPASLRDVIVAGEQLRLTPDIRALFKSLPGCRLHNHYGPTETHVVTALTLDGDDPELWPALPTIGHPISNTHIYLLDPERQPVSNGDPGEIYIGGTSVARGYLNRPSLTAERFLDCIGVGSHPQERAYRTGDIGRLRADGALEFLGRNDQQVKIRGYRVELGEIEARLATHIDVKHVAVIVREDTPGEKRLVAYVIPRASTPPAVNELRSHLSASLPEYMVPAAFVVMEAFPTTPNGKVDRRALPAPDSAAYGTRPYEAPRGDSEQRLAGIWQEVLHIPQVGRDDNFFELGGDSLLVIRMVEKLCRFALSVDTREVYFCPTLSALAAKIGPDTDTRVAVPPNRIPAGSTSITPSMLPLVSLDAANIEEIARQVPGGAANIQDIYPLAPLQQGLLFHHLLDSDRGDTYVLPILLRVGAPATPETFVSALQAVIQRHDSLRTAVLWDQLPSPVQVVYRSAALHVENIELASNIDSVKQLRELMSPRRHRIDLQRAPLMQVRMAADPRSDQWYCLLLLHHLTCDHESLDLMLEEVMAHLEGRESQLPPPVPYRSHVWRALEQTRSDVGTDFFRRKLADLDGPTLPFGLSDVYGDGRQTSDASELLEPALAERVRAQARALNVSVASLFHAAWSLVVSKTSGRDDVVFGTLLSGRMHQTVDTGSVVGMFINTLPLRLRLHSDSAKELVEQTHRELSELLYHEQHSLAAAQRAGGSGSGAAPLFSALLNYLHGASHSPSAPGVEVLQIRECTNYPIVLSVQDLTDAFQLTTQTDRRVDARRLLDYVVEGILSLVEALEHSPRTPARSLSVLPDEDRTLLLVGFNDTAASYPRDGLIHELFEDQVRRAPDAIAISSDTETLTYTQLNDRATRLARSLVNSGVGPGEYVPVLMPRSPDLIIAQLAVLKSGAAYVPIDPDTPVDRQAFMVGDCRARRILAAEDRRPGFDSVEWINCATLIPAPAGTSAADVKVAQLTATSPAYVMYTSGSTGVPKGVIVPHRGVVRLALGNRYASIEAADVFCHCSNPAFDAATFEVWAALLNGASVLIVPQLTVLDAARFREVLVAGRVSVLFLTVGLFSQYVDTLAPAFRKLKYLITGGDIVDPTVARRILRNSPPRHLLNAYGPTEGTTFTTTCLLEDIGNTVTRLPIGRPISNTTVYILDARLQPVPIGVEGQIYIGGDGVALGYLNRPDLTSERFIRDPFSVDPEARLYASGDLAHWSADGNIEFIGRNDNQEKIRGFRIEPAGIETRLLEHATIREAAVIARTDDSLRKYLVAYLTVREEGNPRIEELRAHLKTTLPEYMIPSAFVFLDSLPLTASGKIDRTALPPPPAEAYARQLYEPPRGEVEEMLTRIWQEILGQERIGRHDDFFELGGHSLSATQAIVRIRMSLSIDLPLSALFGFPTIAALSGQIATTRRARLLDKINRGGPELQALLRRVDSMPDAEARQKMRELATGEQL